MSEHTTVEQGVDPRDQRSSQTSIPATALTPAGTGTATATPGPSSAPPMSTGHPCSPISSPRLAGEPGVDRAETEDAAERRSIPQGLIKPLAADV